MADLDIRVWAGFRTHLLLAHDCVGSIIDDKPTFPGVTVDQGVYSREGTPFLKVEKQGDHSRTRVTVRALQDVHLQEPGLSVKIAGEGTWRGFGFHGQWTSGPYTLKQKDAHRSTVHFPRVKTSPKFTVGVEYREGATRYRLRSDGGFVKLLNMPPAVIPWEHCEVFSQGYPLEGVVGDPDEVLRRWELAGLPPNVGQMHFLGWTGGAGAVVNAQGRTPPPGTDVTAADGYDRLWNPRSWRRLGKGQAIVQTLSLRRL